MSAPATRGGGRPGLRWAVYAAVGMLGLATGAATTALWSDDEGFSPTITSGHVHFAVGDPAEPAIAAPYSPTWTVPPDLLGDGTPSSPYLDPGQTAVAVVQIDGQSQGNRGLAYALPQGGVAIGPAPGQGALASALVATIISVAAAAECTPQAVSDAPAPLYEGVLGDAVIPSTELVSTAYSDAPYTEPETDYLCIGFTVPAWPGAYANTGSVRAQTADGTVVTSTDAWHATFLPPATQYTLDITLTFEQTSYRPGGAP